MMTAVSPLQLLLEIAAAALNDSPQDVLNRNTLLFLIDAQLRFPN